MRCSCKQANATERVEWLKAIGWYLRTLSIRKATPALAKYGARFLARGGQVEPKEGQPKSRVVVVEFPSYRAALDCYHSPEYTAAMKLRQSRSLWDMAITEGYEGPQPI